MRTPYTLFLLVFLCFHSLSAQISNIQRDRACIGCKTGEPDPSAALDVVSDDRGILIPRLDSIQVVSNPALGLLIFDKSTSSFKYHNGTTWIEFGGNMESVALGARNFLEDTRAAAIGYRNFATMSGSVAIGVLNSASGANTSAFGHSNGSSALDASTFGRGNTASAIGASAFGALNQAFGARSIVFGAENRVNSLDGGAFGLGNVVNGHQAAAIGNQNQVDNEYGQAIGQFNLVAADSAMAVGHRNQVEGEEGNAFGTSNEVTGANSNAFGYQNDATGSFSSAFGHFNKAMSFESTAFGYNNEAIEESSTAIGYSNEAEGIFSTAIGGDNYALGPSSSAFGNGNDALGDLSSVFGFSSGAYGDRSSALGFHVISDVYGMTAIGIYNEIPIGSETAWISTDPVFAIGNGENFSSRSTALTILKNGKTGIGTTTPDVQLDVAGDGQFSKNGTLSAPQLTLNQEAGDFARMRFTNNNSFTGGNNDFFTIQANVKPFSSGDGRFYISYQDDATISNILTLQVEGTNREVGINDNTPDFMLDVNGTAGKPGGGDWSNASDKRLKKDVEDFKDGLAEVLKIRPVWYRYNGLYGMPTKEKYVGIIAQEMQKVAPYTITPYLATDEKTGSQKEFLSYNGTAVTYMLVNAIQEQQEMIEVKEEKIVNLETRLARLEAILLQNERSSIQKEQLSSARLEQNAPNPFNGKTNIQYYIPEGTNTAILRIADANGRIIKEIPIAVKGEGQIELETSTLNVGNYFYSLFLDGQLFETKQMILQQ